MGGGGHDHGHGHDGHHHNHFPGRPWMVPPHYEPPYEKMLRNPSWFATPGHFYLRETWYPAGNMWSDPKGWRQRAAVSIAILATVWYTGVTWSWKHQENYQQPLVWVPKMMVRDDIKVRKFKYIERLERERAEWLAHKKESGETVAHH